MAIKDKATLQAEKDSLLASSKPGGITAANHRAVETDIIDSSLNLAETALQTVTGPVNFEGFVNLFGNDGVVKIYNASQLPRPLGIPTLLAGKTYQQQESIPDWPPEGVVMEDRSAFVDLNMVNNTITMAGTGDMFHGSGDVLLDGLVLDCPDGQFYNFDDPVGGEKLVIIKNNQNKSCAKVGTLNDHAITVVDFFKVDDADQGFTFSGANKVVHSVSRTAIRTTVGAGFKAIDQTTMVTAFLDYDSHNLFGPAGSVAYSGLANSGNMQAGSVGNVADNTISGGMSTLSGLDENDLGYNYKSTSQVKDSTILGAGYITTEASTTVADGTDDIIAGTYTQSLSATQATIDAAGVITASNIIPSRVMAIAILEVDHPGGGVKSYSFRLQRDAGGVGSWVDIPESVIPKSFQGAETQSITLKGPSESLAGDKFRVVVRGVGTTDSITAKANIFTIEKK